MELYVQSLEFWIKETVFVKTCELNARQKFSTLVQFSVLDLCMCIMKLARSAAWHFDSTWISYGEKSVFGHYVLAAGLFCM